MIDPKIDIQYENRIVAFIDILGFKEIIKKSENDSEQLQTVYEALGFLKKREIPDKWNLKLIEIEEDAQKRGMRGFDISNRTSASAFSDSIVISVQVDDENLDESLSTLVANLSFVGSKLISDGILIRGGLTVGKIVHTDNGIVFGQGLIDAFHLETRAAKFPRIILSDKLINKLNYPMMGKKERYPYHQYLRRFDDGCFGFHQMMYFQVLQNWPEISADDLISGLKKIKETIVNGLDTSFEYPDVFEKYIWLKEQYNDLIILDVDLPKLYELRFGGDEFNIHFKETDRRMND
ncbi:MAG: hypothetical protein ABJN61_11645 [Flavobacteriaceae bacterium]|uniref:hypothetical protein n=1 Tax=Nonlabens ulvanivorans TaxID=906888 RepID=UPI0032970CD7